MPEGFCSVNEIEIYRTFPILQFQEAIPVKVTCAIVVSYTTKTGLKVVIVLW